MEMEIKNTFTKVRDVPKSLLSCVSISSISMPESTYGKSSKIAQNYLALMVLFLFYPGRACIRDSMIPVEICGYLA